MRQPKIQLIVILLILFLLDIIKPFGYALSSEFLFLGIICVALSESLLFSLLVSIIFGYFKDAFGPGTNSFNIIGFIFASIIIHLFRYHLLFAVKKVYYNYINAIIIAIAIIFYALFNFACVGQASLSLFGQFFIQSFLLALLLNYLFKDIVRVYPPEAIPSRR